MYTMLGIIILSVISSGCLTPQGRALKAAGNAYLSTRMQRYCDARSEAERAIIASALNTRLYFAGEIRIVCPPPKP